MKKFLFVALFPLAAFAQQGQGYSIKGNIKGLKDSTLVFLSDGMTGKTIAQDYAYKGIFTLKGKIDEIGFYQLGFIGNKEVVDLFMFNENITVTGEAGKLKSASIIGSKLHADYAFFIQGFTPLSDKIGVLIPKINAEKPGAKRDSMIKQFETDKSKLLAYVTKFTKEKSGSPVSTFVLVAMSQLFDGVADLEKRYNELLPSAKTGVFAKRMQEMIATAKIGTAGTQALEFVQNDTANHPIALSSFRGKYVLVDFWASWCGPCRQENPNVVRAYNAYKDKNFTILGVSLDQQKENWIKAIKDDRLTWTHVSDLKYWNNAVAQLYSIQSIPANMLLDPNGKIIARDLHGPELQQKLKELLK